MQSLMRVLWVALGPVVLTACLTVELREVTLQGDAFHRSEQPLSGPLRERMACVLRYYGAYVQVAEDGSLWIPRGVARDEEMLWNYSNKAKDMDWLRTHGCAEAGQ